MQAINIRIPDELNDKLASLAKSLELPKSYIVRKAIKSYITDLQEEVEDYNDAVKISAMNNPSHSLEQVIKDLGLENELDY